MGAEYKVGYGKPPKDSQFQKGKSGNPKGRRKGSKSLKSIFDEVLFQSVMVRQGDRHKWVPALQAFLMSLLKEAMLGKPKASEQLLKLAEKLGMMVPEKDPPWSSAESPSPFAEWTEEDESGESFLKRLIAAGKPIFPEPEPEKRQAEGEVVDKDQD